MRCKIRQESNCGIAIHLNGVRWPSFRLNGIHNCFTNDVIVCIVCINRIKSLQPNFHFFSLIVFNKFIHQCHHDLIGHRPFRNIVNHGVQNIFNRVINILRRHVVTR